LKPWSTRTKQALTLGIKKIKIWHLRIHLICCIFIWSKEILITVISVVESQCPTALERASKNVLDFFLKMSLNRRGGGSTPRLLFELYTCQNFFTFYFFLSPIWAVVGGGEHRLGDMSPKSWVFFDALPFWPCGVVIH